MRRPGNAPQCGAIDRRYTNQTLFLWLCRHCISPIWIYIIHRGLYHSYEYAVTVYHQYGSISFVWVGSILLYGSRFCIIPDIIPTIISNIIPDIISNIIPMSLYYSYYYSYESIYIIAMNQSILFIWVNLYYCYESIYIIHMSRSILFLWVYRVYIIPMSL